MPDFSDYAKTSDSEGTSFVYFHTAHRRTLAVDMQLDQTGKLCLRLPSGKKRRHLSQQ